MFVFGEFMIEIVRYDYPAFRKQYSLDDVLFYVELKYNYRDNGWFMTILDVSLNIIADSIRLVTEIYLFQNKRSIIGLPKGDFKLKKKSLNQTIELNYDTFGTEYILRYYTEGELI